MRLFFNRDPGRVSYCLVYSEHMNDWECGFVRNMEQRILKYPKQRLSPKASARLGKIYLKVKTKKSQEPQLKGGIYGTIKGIKDKTKVGEN